MFQKNLKFAVILNANAADKKKLRLINKIIELIKRNHSIRLFKTKTEKDAKIVFKKLSVENFDRLVIAGGDGSMSFAINEMINNNIDDKIMGYIPIGTANILQIETKIKKEATEIFNVLVSNNYKKINLTKINEKYFFLMAGIGFDSKIVKSINTKIKKYLGKLIFFYKGLENFLFLKNNKMEIEVENEKMIVDWVLCTNSKYYAGPYSIINDINIFDDKIVTYIFKDLTRIKLLYYIWLILTKGDLSSAKSIIKKKLDTLKINRINNKLLYQVDGENCGYEDKLVISKTKKFINLLIP